MIGLFLMLIARITTSCTSSILQKLLVGRNWSPSFVVAWSLSIVAISLLLATPFVSVPIQLSTTFFAWISVACLLDVVGNILLVRAIGHGDLSVIGPLNSYKPIVGVVLGMLILREYPNAIGLTGIGIVVLGSWILMSRGDRPAHGSRFRLSRPIVDRILSIIFTAGASVFLKHAIEVSHPYQAYLGWAIGCCCLSWISFGLGSLQTKPTIQPKTDHESGSARLRKSSWTGNDYALLVGSGLSFLVMQGATVWLFANMQIGYALALFQLSSMIQVYLGRRIFREEQFVRRLVASGIMTLGAILVLVAK